MHLARFRLLLILALLACGEREPAADPARPDLPPAPTAWVEIAGERFELELALDPQTRYRGLSGRRGLSRNGGMLFVYPSAGLHAMVMRDCGEPLDLAFLDAAGRVVAVHQMQVEPPRGRDESRTAYAARLPIYPSGAAARFAIETAGGRLQELGLVPGQRVVIDAHSLLERAR